MRASDCNCFIPVSTDEFQLVPATIQDAIAHLALNRWPGDFNQQCQEMLWQLIAYCQYRKLQFMKGLDKQPPDVMLDYVAQMESLTNNYSQRAELN